MDQQFGRRGRGLARAALVSKAVGAVAAASALGVVATAGVQARPGTAAAPAADWARHATTLTTSELSQATTDRDIAALDRAVGNSRIVLLGEASHGQHEHFAVKNRIIKHLVTKRGFNTVGLEEGVGRAAAVSSFVADGTASAGTAVDQLQEIWGTEEVVELAEVLRARNSTGREPVTFLGMDIPQAGSELEVDLLTAWFERNDPAYADTAKAALKEFRISREQMDAYRQKPAAEQDAVRAGLEKVEARLEARRSRGLAGKLAAYGLAHQAAVALLGGERHYRLDPTDDALIDDSREQGMTDLVAAFLERDPRAKVIVWAHDMHAGEFRNQYDPSVNHTIKASLGARLTDRFGEDTVTTVGLTFDRGTFAALDISDNYVARKMTVGPTNAGSYEEIFRTSRPGSFVLPLNRGGVDALEAPRPLRVGIGGVYDPTKPDTVSITASLPQVFDAIVHTETTTASQSRSILGARSVSLSGKSVDVVSTCQPDINTIRVDVIDAGTAATLTMAFTEAGAVDLTVIRGDTTYTATGVTPRFDAALFTVTTTATAPDGEKLAVEVESTRAYGC